MGKRGPSISVKMILASTLLITVIVIGLGFLSIYSTREFHRERAAIQTRQFSESLRSKGQSVTLALAQGLRGPLEARSSGDVREIVEELAEKDPELTIAFAIDNDRSLVAHSDSIHNAAGGSFAETPEWQALVAAWREPSATDSNDPLIATAAVTSKTYGRLLFFAYPIFKSGIEPTADRALAESDSERLGFVILGYTLDPIRAFRAEAERQMEIAIMDSVVQIGIVGGIFVLLGTLLSIFQALSISKPLKVLAWRADQIARGDLEARVDVTTSDEIGLLGENFNFMADQLTVLVNETTEKATMEKELEVARSIQSALVPSSDEIDMGVVKLAGYYEPASQCGGDWWSYHQLVGDKVLVVIGDVTGHGVSSAMITATAKAAVDVARDIHSDNVDVSQLLEIMNVAIYESAKRKFVMTCFASIIDPSTRTITFANAGHNFPYLYRISDGSDRGDFGSLMIRGNRLGDTRESKFESKTQDLQRGDLLIWYTDGIVECENAKGEEYSEKRFRQSIRSAASQSPGEVRDHIVEKATSFFGDTPHKDDITMVVARIY